jgi:hypothetical protein
VARDLAAPVAGQRGGLVALFTGTVILWAGLTIATASTWRLIRTVAMAALYIPAGVLAARNRRRVREFLERNPAPDGTTGA